MICLTQRSAFLSCGSGSCSGVFFPIDFFQIRIMAVSGTKYTKKFNRHYKETLENYLSISSLCFWLTYFQASLMDPDPATFTNANSYETESGSGTKRIIDFKNDSKEDLNFPSIAEYPSKVLAKNPNNLQSRFDVSGVLSMLKCSACLFY